MAMFIKNRAWHSLAALCIASGLAKLCMQWVGNGEAVTNQGSIYRNERPTRFWFEVAIWGSGALFVAAIGVLIALGY